MGDLRQDGLVTGEGFDIHPTSTPSEGVDLATIPMKFAKVFDLPPNQQADFKTAARAVLRLCSALENSVDDPLDDEGPAANTKEVRKLKKLETKHGFIGDKGRSDDGEAIAKEIAVSKIQKIVRE